MQPEGDSIGTTPRNEDWKKVSKGGGGWTSDPRQSETVWVI